jgi:hypothetical protein
MTLAFHHVPGRLRVRLSGLKRNARAAALLRTELAAIEGIRSVSANAIRGNIVIHYDETHFDPQVAIDFLQLRGHTLSTPVEPTNTNSCHRGHRVSWCGTIL